MRIVERSGKTFSFPMGTSDRDIAEAMQEYFEHETLPLIGNSAELREISMSGFKGSLATMLTGDMKELGQMLEQNIEGSSVRQDMSGGFIIDMPSGSYALNKPGVEGDILRTGATALAFTPAGMTASAMPTLTSRALVGAGASAATQAGIEATQEKLGGEYDQGEVNFAAILGGGFELIPGGKEAIKRIRQARQNREAARQSLDAATVPDTLEQISKAEQTSGKTGVRFLRAQQSQDPFALQEQEFLAQMPEASRRAFKVLKKQDEEVATMVGDFLKSISPKVPAARVKGQKAAKEAVRQAKKKRADITSPMYNQAFDEFEGTVDIRPVLDEINLRKMQFSKKHPAYKALDEFAEEVELNADSLRKLQSVKEISDRQLNQMEGVNRDAAINKARRELTQVNNILLGQMDKSSELFKQARAEFERLSPSVDKITKGIVGSISETKPTQLKNLAKRIFDPAEVDSRVLLETKRAIKATEDGENVWNALIRDEMERRLRTSKNSLDDVLGGNQRMVQNVPANILNALFPNSGSREVIRASLDKQGRQQLGYVEDALRRAASGRGIGSQTGIRQEIKARFGNGPANAIRRFFKAPVDTVAEIGEDTARSARIMAISEVAFNPDWQADLAKIARLERLGEFTKAEQLAMRLLTNAEKSVMARAVLQATTGE